MAADKRGGVYLQLSLIHFSFTQMPCCVKTGEVETIEIKNGLQLQLKHLSTSFSLSF